jgi:proteasome lid subunit RPN8/RPN11
MWQALLDKANVLFRDLASSLFRTPLPAVASAVSPQPLPPPPQALSRLRQVRLTDGVGRTLFEEYAAHRARQGEVETGWMLLGLREADEAIVVATLPAGAEADAGVAHVRFNSEAQVVASRIVRQNDRRLRILGVVHTHPGSLRHPSEGDLRGDRQWVGQLRGGDGVFGIGTADGVASGPTLIGQQPRPHVQVWGELRFTWYGLAATDRSYRPLPVEVTYGPDLARPLHDLWPVLEAHASRLERLFKQQAGLRFEVVDGPGGKGLVLLIPLAEPASTLRVLVRQKDVRYYVVRGDEVFEVEHGHPCPDRGVYLLLAELAGEA